MHANLHCGQYLLPTGDLTALPIVMGILNVTPDSFSDGGQFDTLEMALNRAEQMLADGVDVIDIGGESSRPGALALPLDQELQRVMPALYALRGCGKPISVDTYKPQVMREAIIAGASMINDINAFCAPGAIDAVKDSDCGLCIMHMQRNPQTMQQNPHYQDVLQDVISFLKQRVAVLEEAGIARNRLCIDPGFGFGKTLAHNLVLLKNIGQIQAALDLPLLAGLSRKSMIGALIAESPGKLPAQRMAGSLAGALVAAGNGARLLRVHEVAETVDALKVWHAATQ